ncbi:UDP-N-acetylmuramoyl-L-alanine--D-glutamate ligase [Dasania sp. GY-MA-18]|uniref:UDP-N-acetylmuramoylalanine--D-glutamate ligase n=1 Tax=Dasania phycosphaerae TaxID=2950436 RepID=A0A9J6RNP7_9GAMM|nr:MULTISPECIES: UDP-N-acetylmuramoyl-L-alanine--D-glutamate ligase [Dasania]MCR8923690.1 UDP-N-acetylmuramoyl-L-alanine--D-glutamate ligase [Dasania sp. GY-MA-18]MCZ0866124.1 UDP-N-acetylmuramoyl-L-alanine--D-glutamate ligase [Dasania phycosphaerae]MCZ0869848.1 UDP-N-acetylmuramoyl-L-alanine--D-glutamate ligase [Dasania phycosphaerae]
MQIIAKDNHCVVVGLGLTGLSCARYLASKNIPFSVVDSREQPPGLKELQQELPDVAVSLGAITDEALANANELIISPGVSLEQPAIQRAIAAGTAYCGDIDLFRREAKAPIIAITGSNGKSTVTALVGEMAAAAGKRVAVGGNIGVPALALLAEPEPDLYVLELSSFQLERAQPLNAEVATVLNISPDHMDRYSDIAAYHRAKHRIFFGCKQVVVNCSDTLSKPLVPDEVKQWHFGLGQPDFKGFGLIKEGEQEFLAFQFEKLMPVSELKIVGRHNIENALAALALGHAAGLPFAAMLKALRNFAGLPHRCQFVASIAGVKYYNDSKATNVGAALAAIEGLAASVEKIVLIAGGEGKGASFDDLLVPVQRACSAAVLIGTEAQVLADLLSPVVKVSKAGSMVEAVAAAKALAKEGDAVLLAPACASFDMYSNYQQRGDDFCAAVNALKNKSVH